MSTIDAYGRVSVSADEIVEILYNGGDITKSYVEAEPRIEAYNALCERWLKDAFKLHSPEQIDHSPEEEMARRKARFLIPEEFLNFDIAEFVISLCETDAEIARCEEELSLFVERGFMPILQIVVFLVTHWREQGVVFGVGRGSSVASYVLFKLGVHKIDAMKYGLDISEFMR